VLLVTAAASGQTAQTTTTETSTTPPSTTKPAAPAATGTAKKTTSTSSTSPQTTQKTTTDTQKSTPAAPAQPTAKPATRASVSRALAAERQRAVEEAKRRQQQEALKAVFTRDAQGNLVPEVRAAAAIVYDPRNGDVIWDQNSHDQRSIASLTKVMTAITFIADSPDLSQKVTVTRADVVNASTTYLKSGDRISYNDLLHLALIASDNAAARVLARTSEGGTAAFVSRMNERAAQLNLTSTHYVDPSGLDADNVSSAFDLSHLIVIASSNDRLGPIMRAAEYEVRTSTRAFSIHSTNRLLASTVGAEVLGAKTGFINKAGYCLATLLQMPQGSRVAVVVLGATTSTTRFNEAVNLFNWARGKAQGLVGGDELPKR
jgi:D-alanyl-D-alanine endopeptidase (penicillin-binding protein 7)